eukprot:737655_1
MCKSKITADTEEMIAPKNGGIITDIQKNDVLCGRGGAINSHHGNIEFRALVSQHRGVYLSASTKKLDKADIAAQIVHIVRSMNPPGRFLKEDRSHQGWFEIGDVKAIKKAGQAMREHGCSKNKKLKQLHEQIKEARNLKEIGASSTNQNWEELALAPSLSLAQNQQELASSIANHREELASSIAQHREELASSIASSTFQRLGQKRACFYQQAGVTGEVEAARNQDEIASSTLQRLGQKRAFFYQQSEEARSLEQLVAESTRKRRRILFDRLKNEPSFASLPPEILLPYMMSMPPTTTCDNNNKTDTTDVQFIKIKKYP